MYVWFDALANYLTAVHGSDATKPFWPANVHLIGKDILRFHAVYWPAFMLMAADLPLPKQILRARVPYVRPGQKMSKTLRNTVSPVGLAHVDLSDAARGGHAAVLLDAIHYLLRSGRGLQHRRRHCEIFVGSRQCAR